MAPGAPQGGRVSLCGCLPARGSSPRKETSDNFGRWYVCGAEQTRSESLLIRPLATCTVGVDDAGAILWALGSDRLEVLGIVATHGCHWDVGVMAQNAERLLARAGRSDVPVFRGSRYPFGEDEPSSSDGTLFHGPQGFTFSFDDSTEDDCKLESDSRVSGAEFIAATARARPGQVELLCFSALTNVAVASLLEPNLPSLVARLVVMGGSVYAPGNISPLAEANFFHDAKAARMVIREFSEAETETPGGEMQPKLVLAPLDVTLQAILGPELLARAAEAGDAGRLFAQATPVYQKAYCEVAGRCSGIPLHDAHTVAFSEDPSLYPRTEVLHIEVLVSQLGDHAHGMSLIDRRLSGSEGANLKAGKVLVLLDVRAEEFSERFLDRLAALDKQLE